VKRSSNNPWLCRFTWFTALCTWLLIGLGGLVTSKGVGMSVPDWPTTYGYNMFLFPIHMWDGGIFYEHSHRLFASFVGLLTTVIAVWVQSKEDRRWLRVLGWAAFVGVVLQGVLGGLRVRLSLDGLGIPHAALAQLFLCLLVFMGVVTSRWWERRWSEKWSFSMSPSAQRLVLLTTVLIFVQLLIAAGMRHQHAGLAVPDFPLAYGKIYPPTDATFVEEINRKRMHPMDFNEITAFQIHLHMLHRFVAYALLVLITVAALKLHKALADQPLARRVATGWLILIWVQAGMGIVTVLKNKPADIATLHVMTGALTLLAGFVLSVLVQQFSVATQKSVVQSPARPIFGPNKPFS